MSDWHPDNATDCSWFENPVYGDIFLRTAKPEDLDKVQQCFAIGNWSVFAVWARALMAGSIKSPFPNMPSPHCAFWSYYLTKVTTSERDEFLKFLLRAQMAHLPINDRPGRGPVPGFSPVCKTALLAYLFTFTDPKHAPDPNTVLGGLLLCHDFLPDDRMVHLTGQFGLVEAIPVLERLLNVQRRFFQLYTDYSTSPEEVDQVFLEAIRALVRIGLANPQVNDKVQQILKTNHTPIAKNTKGQPKGSETVWFEIYNDGGGEGPCSRHVKTEQFNVGCGIPLKAELQLLGSKALEKDGPERRDLLEGRTDKYPVFSWIVKEAEGQGMIIGDRLFYIGAAKVEAIDLPTGNTVFRFDSGQNNSNQGVACYYHLLSVTTTGDPLLVTQVIPLGAGNGRAWWAIVLDRDTGEVKRSFQLAVQPERAYGPQTWPQKDDSIVFRQEKKLWRQSSNGQTLWTRDIDYQATVQCANGTIAILTKTELTLASVDGFTVLLVLPVKDIFKELEPSREMELREDIVLLDDRIYLFSRFDGPILAYDLKGKLLWKDKPKEGGYYLNHPRAVGKGLCGDLNNYIYQVLPDGKMRYIDKPSGMKDDYLSNDLGVFMRTDNTIYYWPYGEEKIRTPVQQIPWQAQLIALSNDYLVVNFYDNERYLACLSKVAW
jgi:hypothetical protein